MRSPLMPRMYVGCTYFNHYRMLLTVFSPLFLRGSKKKYNFILLKLMTLIEHVNFGFEIIEFETFELFLKITAMTNVGIQSPAYYKR